MIVGHQKPLEEIAEMIGKYNKVLNIGCGGCTSICLAGGQREVDVLNGDLSDHFGNKGHGLQLDQFTIERHELQTLRLAPEPEGIEQIGSVAYHGIHRLGPVMAGKA